MSIHTHIPVYIYITDMYTRNMSVYVYMYVYIYIYIYTYTNTCILQIHTIYILTYYVASILFGTFALWLSPGLNVFDRAYSAVLGFQTLGKTCT